MCGMFVSVCICINVLGKKKNKSVFVSIHIYNSEMAHVLLPRIPTAKPCIFFHISELSLEVNAIESKGVASFSRSSST